MAKSQAKIHRMVGMAIFIAIIVVLTILASYIRFGPFSITLALIPIVVGAAVYGPAAGAVFGGTFGTVVLIHTISGVDAGAYVLWAANPAVTAALCLGKGILAGFLAGLVYSAISKRNRTLGVMCAAIVCPVANTGIFLAAMALFYHDILTQWAGNSPLLYFLFVGLAGINFLLELGANIVLSPVVVRIIAAAKRT